MAAAANRSGQEEKITALYGCLSDDDGVSGTTFERPGFKEMDALVEAGRVSTVIVKDLSRFGRNYLEVRRYLEVVYPTLGVKFIASQENCERPQRP